MTTTDATAILREFRQTLYQTILGHRKDTLFALMEATLTVDGPRTLVRLSLAPSFERGWASACDGLDEGTLDVEAARRSLRRLAMPLASGEAAPERPLWALDASTWPRPAAATSPERTFAYRAAPGTPQAGVVPGWEYQWLFVVPDADGSWALPLDGQRRTPTTASPTALAIEQLQAALQERPAEAPRPVATLDSGYDPVALARANLALDLLVRLAKHRVVFRDPGPYRGRGRPAKHGPVLRFKDPMTHGTPDRTTTMTDPAYGQVTVSVWQPVHVRAAPDAPFTVVRITVERLPRRAKAPGPLWLAWLGGPLPEDLLLLWYWYRRRFTAEHGFRFLKRGLGWTTVRPQAPEAADRWSWLLAGVLWQLWLARPLVADQRLPWERPVPPERLSPGRVRRAVAGLLLRLGTPVRPVKPRGKAPGRRPGHGPGPRPRHPVVRRPAKAVA